MYKVYSLYACPIWKLLETYTIMPACLYPLKTSRLHPATVEVSTRRKWKLWPRAPTFLHMPAPHKPTVACSRNPCPETICPICPQKGNGREDLSDQIWPERFHAFFATMDHHWYHSHWGANLPFFPWKSGQKRFRCRNFWTCKASPEWLCYAQVGAKARGTAVPGLGLTQSDVCDSYQIAPDKLCLLGLDTSRNFIDIQLHCHGLTISLCVKIAAVWLDQLRKTAWLDMLCDFGWFGGTPHCRKLPYVCKMVYLGKPQIPRHHFLQRNAFGGHLRAKRLLSRGWWVLQGSCIPSEQGTEHRKQQIRKQPNRQALFLRSKYEYIIILRVFQALSKVTWHFFPFPWKMQDANMFAHGLSSSNCISERCL